MMPTDDNFALRTESRDSSALRELLSRHVGDHGAVVRALGLPPRRFYTTWDSGRSCGVNRILNAYCGLRFPGEWPLAGFWSHGWLPSFGMRHPYQVACLAKPGDHARIFVPRIDMVELLKRHGYDDVRAVGLPFAYLPEAAPPRWPQSVLFVPAHSVPDLGLKHKDLLKAADVLIDLQRHFEVVVGCVHSQCLKNGNWLEDFQRAGIPYVSGANMRDANSLYRLRHLFSQFQVVVTNSSGSHIAYAAACGTAVAFSGDYVALNRQQLLTDIFYAKHPEVLDAAIEAHSEKVVRRHCPFLWTAPQQAVPQIEWARRELGYDCRLAPEDAVEAFGLRPQIRLGNAVKRAGSKLYYAVSRRLFRLQSQ